MDKINKLTKSALLSLTLGGLLYFFVVFPQLRGAKINDRRFKNVINHLRGERKASLSCYYKGDRWYLHDHADPDFSGDMFSIYAIVNKIKDMAKNFKQILQGIYTAVTGEEAPEVVTNASKSVNMEKAELPEATDFLLEEISFDVLGKDEKEFLQKRGISIKDMERFGSVFVRSYTFTSNSGVTYKISKGEGEVFIAHKYKNAAKIYKPYADEYKFMWLGEKPKDYVYGLQQLQDLYNQLDPKNPDRKPIDGKIQIVLCAGEKDTLETMALGFIAICLNSETSTFFPENLLILLLDINDFCNELELVIVYDNDTTGKKQAKRIAEKQARYDYAIRVVELPEILTQNQGKDISDWITLGLPKKSLIELIKGDEFSSPISPVSHQVDIPEDSTAMKPISINNTKEEIEEMADIENDSTDENVVIEFEPIEDNLSLVTEDIYNKMPLILQKIIKPFDNPHKTMMLLASITSIGSVLHNIVGKFRKDKVYPNLYTVIIAPPASGKSFIKWARYIVLPIERFIVQQSKNYLSEYLTKKQLVSKGELDECDLGSKPPYKVHLLPTDITSAMFIKQLAENNGNGLMYDTEIDSLVESNSGNLRSFNDLLRKASEGEPITLMRKKDEERVAVEEGKLSLLISGTPKQFFKLIPDAENGMFSRIIPFKFNGCDSWIDAFELDEIDYDEYFEAISQEVFEVFEEMSTYEEEPLRFQLTNNQLIALDKEFSNRLERVKRIAGVDGRATVYRLGTMTVKIAMILNTLKRIENNELYSINQCYDDDFQTALFISGVILDHVISTLKLMNDDRIENTYRGKKLDYFYALPNEFTYSESQEIADDENVKLRTAQKWIYDFRNKGFLVNPEKGFFKKVA